MEDQKIDSERRKKKELLSEVLKVAASAGPEASAIMLAWVKAVARLDEQVKQTMRRIDDDLD